MYLVFVNHSLFRGIKTLNHEDRKEYKRSQSKHLNKNFGLKFLLNPFVYFVFHVLS